MNLLQLFQVDKKTNLSGNAAVNGQVRNPSEQHPLVTPTSPRNFSSSQCDKVGQVSYFGWNSPIQVAIHTTEEKKEKKMTRLRFE